MAGEETTGGVAYAGEELKLESRKPKSPDARRSRALTHWRGPLTPDVDLDDLIEGDAILAGSVSAARTVLGTLSPYRSDASLVCLSGYFSLRRNGGRTRPTNMSTPPDNL